MEVIMQLVMQNVKDVTHPVRR